MTAEMDATFSQEDILRRLHDLELWKSQLDNAGLDRLRASGYLQFDSIPMRWDPTGMQVATGGSGTQAVYFFDKLQADTTHRPSGIIAGSADDASDSVDIDVAAYTNNGNYALINVGANAEAGVPEAEVVLEVFEAGGSVTPKAILKTTDGIAVLELSNVPLLLHSGTADLAGMATDGALQYRSDTDKFRARINGVTENLATEAYADAAGGGSMPMPPIVGTGNWHCIGAQLAASASAAPASATWPSANKAIYIPLLVTEDITVRKLWWLNGGAASGNVNMALYTAAFAQVSGTETGSTAQSGTNVMQEVDIADTALTAGLYYLALVMDNTTGTMFRYTQAVASVFQSYGLAEEASVFDLPATATPADLVAGYAPICGIATRTQVA